MKITDAILVAVIGFAGVIVGGVVNPSVDAFLRAHLVNDRMVELAVDILKSSDCKTAPNLAAARPWAVSVIEKFSPVPMDADVKSALLNSCH